MVMVGEGMVVVVWVLSYLPLFRFSLMDLVFLDLVCVIWILISLLLFGFWFLSCCDLDPKSPDGFNSFNRWPVGSFLVHPSQSGQVRVSPKSDLNQTVDNPNGEHYNQRQTAPGEREREREDWAWEQRKRKRWVLKIDFFFLNFWQPTTVNFIVIRKKKKSIAPLI